MASSVAEETQSDSSKLRTFLSILKKFIGVSDLAAVRFSLPSQLLEPTPNLEYWNYLDAPNAFVAIGTSDDPLDRMLEVLRFWFTKDLKYAKGRPCKPYNSCLGEFFRCNWETENNAPAIDHTAHIKSSSAASLGVPGHDKPAAKSHKPVRVSYLTEQTSHHPPISAFYVSCPERGLTARGFDQISAKFTGTTIKVLPGEHNLGIFINLEKRNETYQLLHPEAHLAGFLRGNLNVSVSDTTFITCPESKLKVILVYFEEGGWLGKAVNKVEGIIFKYDPNNDNKTQIKEVPEADILVRFSGPWKEKVSFTLGPKPFTSHPPEAQHTIIDINPLSVAPKTIPPREKQRPNESLVLWGKVTDAISAKQFSKATNLKVELEEAQREKARERERTGKPFTPVFFKHVNGNGGKPDLTEKGVAVLKRAQEGNWDIDDLLSDGSGAVAEDAAGAAQASATPATGT
ncbi:Oxysterol-binding protein-like protein 1 [Ceratocystis fimbriata CBS 114723]|uniref:Oxysterol-binding protein-like protein 1 n=1 Tax=Ceratocystis fimbriata CBS 114723 TaxID=1035309 RepID=A0A2C5WK53_9PEZI|nr:Oxysterol-binding protein-like protein 1 [Ceratocystis fimbriata CBS 114723]